MFELNTFPKQDPPLSAPEPSYILEVLIKLGNVWGIHFIAWTWELSGQVNLSLLGARPINILNGFNQAGRVD